MVNSVNEKIVDELSKEWKMLWRDRFDDRVSAEGIASQDYPGLDVERGLVVVATRDYKPPDFAEILKRHNVVFTSPSVGGWGKFVKDSVKKQKRFTVKESSVPSKSKRDRKQQCKKGGRGWLHL